MQHEVIEEKSSDENGIKTVTVKLNNHPVTFQDHKTTGLEIKRTAIQQGVVIQEDFNLFRVKGAGKLDPIADDESVTLHENEEFRATAPDDNS
ncbi:MAG: multiubiquitin domain-containing protein [Bellilinea sp.]